MGWVTASTRARSPSPTGTPEAAEAIERVLTNDPGTGVMRHADAGYEQATRCARERGVIPMV